MNDEHFQYQQDFEARLEAAGADPRQTAALFQYFHDERTREQADSEAARYAVIVLGATLPGLEEAVQQLEAQQPEYSPPDSATTVVESDPIAAGPEFDLFARRDRLALAVTETFLAKHPDHQYLYWNNSGVHFVKPDGGVGTIEWSSVERED